MHPTAMTSRFPQAAPWRVSISCLLLAFGFLLLSGCGANSNPADEIHEPGGEHADEHGHDNHDEEGGILSQHSSRAERVTRTSSSPGSMGRAAAFQ